MHDTRREHNELDVIISHLDAELWVIILFILHRLKANRAHSDRQGRRWKVPVDVHYVHSENNHGGLLIISVHRLTSNGALVGWSRMNGEAAITCALQELKIYFFPLAEVRGLLMQLKELMRSNSGNFAEKFLLDKSARFEKDF